MTNVQSSVRILNDCWPNDAEGMNLGPAQPDVAHSSGEHLAFAVVTQRGQALPAGRAAGVAPHRRSGEVSR
jgi:hypothetical protein